MAWMSVVFPVPKSPENPTTAGAWRPRPKSSPNRLSSAALRRTANGISFRPEFEDLVAQHRRHFEIELLRRGLHLALEQFDQRLALLGVRRPNHALFVGFAGAGVGEARDETDVAHRFDDGPRRDVVLHVVRELRGAPPVHLAEGALHRAGLAVGVEPGAAGEMARRPAHRLIEGAGGAQEALLVGVEDRYERHLGHVETLAQEVDAHEHVEFTQAQPPDDLDALDGVDL